MPWFRVETHETKGFNLDRLRYYLVEASTESGAREKVKDELPNRSEEYVARVYPYEWD